MRLGNTEHSWGALARLLHWSVAAMILFLLGLGVWMTHFVDDTLAQFRLVQTHKSWGFVVFTLALLRVGWRLLNRRSPGLPDHMHPLEKLGAKLGHLGLYTLMFIMPLSGWLMSSASPLQDRFGVKNKVFNWFEMYDPFVPGNEALAGFFAKVHFLSAIAFGLVLVGHVAAAFWHHLHHKDDVMRRMTWGK